MDIAIPGRPQDDLATASDELRDMKNCGSNLEHELEYQSAKTSNIFTAVRSAIMLRP